MKPESGRHHKQMLLGTEIWPDTCRVWDLLAHEKPDRNRFRQDLGGEEASKEVLRRLCAGA